MSDLPTVKKKDIPLAVLLLAAHVAVNYRRLIGIFTGLSSLGAGGVIGLMQYLENVVLALVPVAMLVLVAMFVFQGKAVAKALSALCAHGRWIPCELQFGSVQEYRFSPNGFLRIVPPIWGFRRVAGVRIRHAPNREQTAQEYPAAPVQVLRPDILWTAVRGCDLRSNTRLYGYDRHPERRKPAELCPFHGCWILHARNAAGGRKKILPRKYEQSFGDHSACRLHISRGRHNRLFFLCGQPPYARVHNRQLPGVPQEVYRQRQ